MRTLILADIHGNLPALESVLKAEPVRDAILFLGDAPSDGPHPDEVVRRLGEVQAVCIRGNHDTDLLEMDMNRPPASPHQAWMHWCRSQLSDESLALMRSWPASHQLTLGATALCMLHGVLPAALGKRLWPDSPDEAYAFLAEPWPVPTILVGHSHVQSIVKRVGRVFCNPGSVGQQRLGRAEACYAVLDGDSLSLYSAPYEVDAVARDMARIPIDATWMAERIAAFRQGRLPDSDSIGRLTRLETGGFR